MGKTFDKLYHHKIIIVKYLLSYFIQWCLVKCSYKLHLKQLHNNYLARESDCSYRPVSGSKKSVCVYVYALKTDGCSVVYMHTKLLIMGSTCCIRLVQYH